MTIAFEEGFFRTTSNKFILEANLPSMKGVVETWEGMAKEVGHQVSRNEGQATAKSESTSRQKLFRYFALGFSSALLPTASTFRRINVTRAR